MHCYSFIVYLWIDYLLCATLCVRCWCARVHVCACVCVWHTHSYTIYSKLQIMASVKQEIYLSRGWQRRRGVILNLHKRVKEGLSGDWAFRLRKEGPEGGSVGKEKPKQKKQNGQSPEVGTSLRYLRNWKGASVGWRSCELIGPFGWGPPGWWWSPKISPSELVRGLISSLHDL